MCELELPQAPYVCVCYFTHFATTQYRNSITKLIYLIFFPLQVKESACFSILLLQRALGDLALFLGDFKIANLDNETTRLLPSVEWIDAMKDFVPGKRNKEILAVLSKDKGRLRYLMVCNG